jgi:hypothetical protein
LDGKFDKLDAYCSEMRMQNIHMSSNEVTEYFDSQEFVDEAQKLNQVTGDAAELLRSSISLKWSESLIGKGCVPTERQSYAAATFVLGEISLEEFVASIRE